MNSVINQFDTMPQFDKYFLLTKISKVSLLVALQRKSTNFPWIKKFIREEILTNFTHIGRGTQTAYFYDYASSEKLQDILEVPSDFFVLKVFLSQEGNTFHPTTVKCYFTSPQDTVLPTGQSINNVRCIKYPNDLPKPCFFLKNPSLQKPEKVLYISKKKNLRRLNRTFNSEGTFIFKSLKFTGVLYIFVSKSNPSINSYASSKNFFSD